MPSQRAGRRQRPPAAAPLPQARPVRPGRLRRRLRPGGGRGGLCRLRLLVSVWGLYL